MFEAFCERYDEAYNEFLEENELKDTAETQEEFALSRYSAFADFDAAYNEDLELSEADSNNDWAKAEGA